jgi:adenylate cyclase
MLLPSEISPLERVKARFAISGQYAYLLGCLFHLIFLVVFALIDQWVLAYFNIFSVAVFALGGFLHLRGRVLAGYILVSVEIPAHSVLATVMMGSESGFFLYLVGPPIFVWVLPFFSLAARLSLVGFFAVAFAFLAAYSIYFRPLNPLADGWAFAFTIANGLGLVSLILGWVGFYNSAMLRAEAALEKEHERSESLLRNILPTAIAERLKGATETIGDQHAATTVLFADIVGFSEIARRMPAGDLVRLLNAIFTEFDDLAAKHGLEKIKTIGDAYLVVGGLPEADPRHAERIARFALDILDAAARHKDDRGEPVRLRVGINTGPVVAGVIGKRKFAYDLWGDAVNIAARMEQTTADGTIRASAAAQALLAEQFRFGPPTEADIKGFGTMTVYTLEGVG